MRDLNDEHKDITPLIDFILENVKPAESNQMRLFECNYI